MALATTSEPRAVDRHAGVLGLVPSVADITTSEGAGASTQPTTIAEGVSYNDTGGGKLGFSGLVRTKWLVTQVDPQQTSKGGCKVRSVPTSS